MHIFKSIHQGFVEYMIWLSADKIATCSNGGHIKISQLGNSQPLYEMKSAEEVMNIRKNGINFLLIHIILYLLTKQEKFNGLWWNVTLCKLATCGGQSGHLMVMIH